MKTYVLGFLFNTDCTELVMIRKKRPNWQLDQLNGLGGEINPGETMREAMVREFLEEAGVDTYDLQWCHFGHFYGKGFRVCCFAVSDQSAFDRAKTMTDEEIEKVGLDELPNVGVVRNVLWLAPLADEAINGNGMAMALEYL